jgi:hypothetical protein
MLSNVQKALGRALSKDFKSKVLDVSVSGNTVYAYHNGDQRRFELDNEAMEKIINIRTKLRSMDCDYSHTYRMAAYIYLKKESLI